MSRGLKNIIRYMSVGVISILIYNAFNGEATAMHPCSTTLDPYNLDPYNSFEHNYQQQLHRQELRNLLNDPTVRREFNHQLQQHDLLNNMLTPPDPNQ